MVAIGHPLVARLAPDEISASTRKLFAVQISGAFIMTDTALSWILYGVVFVGTPSAARLDRALRSGC
jgi:hypothetical protein